MDVFSGKSGGVWGETPPNLTHFEFHIEHRKKGKQSIHNDETKQAKFTDQNMSNMRTPFHMAQKMGKGLGKREVLQRTLPTA